MNFAFVKINHSDFSVEQRILCTVSTFWPCHKCEQLEKQIRENIVCVNQVLDDKDQTIEERKKVLNEHGRRLDSLMSEIMNKSGSLENTNDEFSNTKLAQRFDSRVKDLWIDVCEDLETEYTEIKRLRLMSKLCKKVFTAFQSEIKQADDKLLESIFSDENTVPEMIFKEVRFARALNGAKTATRKRQVQKILESINWSEDIKTLLCDTKWNRMQTFLTEFAEVCWLMVTSNPPLILNFDVKGKQYTTDIRDKFVVFGISEAISDCRIEPGHVLLVAWPSVELEDNKGYLTKGEVVVMPNKTNN